MYLLVYDDYLEGTSGLTNISLGIRLCVIVYRDAACGWFGLYEIVVRKWNLLPLMDIF